MGPPGTNVIYTIGATLLQNTKIALRELSGAKMINLKN
jgi:hypothetical protein